MSTNRIHYLYTKMIIIYDDNIYVWWMSFKNLTILMIWSNYLNQTYSVMYIISNINTITKIIGTIFIVEWKDYEGFPTFFFKF